MKFRLWIASPPMIFAWAAFFFCAAFAFVNGLIVYPLAYLFLLGEMFIGVLAVAGCDYAIRAARMRRSATIALQCLLIALPVSANYIIRYVRINYTDHRSVMIDAMCTGSRFALLVWNDSTGHKVKWRQNKYEAFPMNLLLPGYTLLPDYSAEVIVPVPAGPVVKLKSRPLELNEFDYVSSVVSYTNGTEQALRTVVLPGVMIDTLTVDNRRYYLTSLRMTCTPPVRPQYRPRVGLRVDSTGIMVIGNLARLNISRREAVQAIRQIIGRD